MEKNGKIRKISRRTPIRNTNVYAAHSYRAAFFDNAHSPFVIFDKDLVFIDINHTALEALNIDRSDVIGKKLTKVLPYVERTERFKAYQEVIKTGISIDVDEVSLTVRDRLFKFSLKVFKVGDGLGLAALNTTKLLHTISQLKDAKCDMEVLNRNLSMRNEELEELSYVAAHDLKAPLSNLTSILEMVGEQNQYEEYDVLVKKAEEVCNLMDKRLRTLNEVIALKSNIGGKKSLHSFQETLDTIKTEISHQVEDSNAIIESDFSACPSLLIDRIQLHSLMQNLIVNSIKYRSPNRQLIISLKTEMVDDKVVLSIKDNGLGFDNNRGENKIFGLFKRMHTHVEGQGVGLYIVKSIVNSLGGCIEVQSEPDQGTLFKLFLQ